MTTLFKKVVSSLIDRQFKKQELTQAFLRRKKSPTCPCITVSRETGSGGQTIAMLVAKKLKMKFYNKQLVNLVAKSAKKREETIKSLDEKSKNMVESVIDTLRLNKNKLSEARYFKHLCQAILPLAQKEKVVILGRGANFIIPPDKALRVRIIAPFNTRVNNTAIHEKKTLKQAKAYVRRVHVQRKNFIRKYFRKDISNANYYDLVINTQRLSLEKAVNLIIKAFKEKFS